jgi:hypothetical protein
MPAFWPVYVSDAVRMVVAGRYLSGIESCGLGTRYNVRGSRFEVRYRQFVVARVEVKSSR